VGAAHVAARPAGGALVATPLVLFFDLVFVVAIASAAAELHHSLSADHLDAVVGCAMVFFAIWWAWMNYTWFASAYDSDEVAFRLLTFTIRTGSLMLAAGVPDLFDDGQSGVVVAGYAVMRLGMVGFWLRAAWSHPEGRRTALTYAVGLAVLLIGVAAAASVAQHVVVSHRAGLPA
jgi:low temperature requirement protein LtrA